MPVVASSKDPAKGSVHFELTVGDLDSMFSNRYLMFANGWDDAVLALEHDIDPAGKFKIWTRPRPQPVRQVPLREGNFSRHLIDPAAPIIWTPEVMMHRLLATLARINKYGEPAFGLRNAMLRLARFLVDDLANITVDIARSDPRGRGLRQISSQARIVLRNIIVQANPEPNSLFVPFTDGASSGELKLDILDLANASLDVLWSADEEHRQMLPPRILTTPDLTPDLSALVAAASARGQCGGKAAPNSALDAVACHAFSTLVALADTRNPGSRPVRDQLWDACINGGIFSLTAGEKVQSMPAWKAARMALVWAGGEDAQEVDRDASALFYRGLPTGGANEQVQDEVVTMMRALTLYAGGANHDAGRELFAARFEKIFADLEKKKQDHVATDDELSFLDRWNATSGKTALGTVSPPCAADPGESKPRIFLYAICSDGLQVIDKLYIGVPTIIEAQFDPPSGKAEIPLEISFGGEKIKLTAHLYGDKAYIFRTDPFLPTNP